MQAGASFKSKFISDFVVGTERKFIQNLSIELVVQLGETTDGDCGVNLRCNLRFVAKHNSLFGEQVFCYNTFLDTSEGEQNVSDLC